MAHEIPLTRGKVAIVDDTDYEWLSQWKWSCHINRSGNCYAVRTAWNPRRYIRMHRLITDAPRHLEVDHINGDGLDNRRSNLRLVTRSQNTQNRKPYPNSTSRFKGVSFNKRLGKYEAQIQVRQGRVKRKFHLGLFYSEEEAARIYDAAAAHHFGEFAKLNFPHEAQP
jgi:hypothetical protein